MNRRYRRALIVGNWKMNKTPAETSAFFAQFRVMLPQSRQCAVAVCVPAVCIPAAVKAVRRSRIAIGAQCCSSGVNGNCTGEISAAMLQDAGCKYVLVGHSDRRAAGETDRAVHAGIKTVLGAGLNPILCCGEGLEYRQFGTVRELLTLQLLTALKDVSAEELRHVVIAYEPRWAVETGNIVSPAQAQQVCGLIRSVLRKQYGARIARKVVLLYGGSMDAENAVQFLAQPDVDGCLIDSLSLEPEQFISVLSAFAQAEHCEK